MNRLKDNWFIVIKLAFFHKLKKNILAAVLLYSFFLYPCQINLSLYLNGNCCHADPQ